MGGNVPGPPAPILVPGDILDRLFPQATDSFQVLKQPDCPRPDGHVIRHGISPVMPRRSSRLTVPHHRIAENDPQETPTRCPQCGLSEKTQQISHSMT
jgi:hypothetical protein